MTALARAEPATGAQHPAVQRLQFFLSGSRWDPGAVNTRRLEPLRAGPATAPHAYGNQDMFRAEPSEAGLAFVMALKPRRGIWAYGPDAHTPVDAARELAWDGPDDPGELAAGDPDVPGRARRDLVGGRCAAGTASQPRQAWTRSA